MPHFVVEYTDNIPNPRINELLTAVNDTLRTQDDVYPLGGIRSRAIRLTEYAIADEAADYRFVHATLAIGAGRSAAIKKQTGDAIFAVMTRHFAEAYAEGLVALSLEVTEMEDAGTWKKNNIHARFKPA